MDKREKKRIRDFIGEHLDVSNTRLTDEEASQLNDFIGNYDSAYKGKTDSRSRTFDSWSSDGKYTRHEKFTDTFTTEGIGIRKEYEYHDDDGQTDTHISEVRDARGILNWFKERR